MLALYPFPISNKNIIIYTSISSFKYIQIRVKSNRDFIIFDKEKSTQVKITPCIIEIISILNFNLE